MKIKEELSNFDAIIKDLSLKSSDFLVKIVIALIVMIIGFKIINVLENRLEKPHKFNKIDPSVKTFMISFITISLKILLMIIVL